jgi:hypothetical protein
MSAAHRRYTRRKYEGENYSALVFTSMWADIKLHLEMTNNVLDTLPDLSAVFTAVFRPDK